MALRSGEQITDGGIIVAEGRVLVSQVLFGVARHYPLGAVALNLSLQGLTAPEIASELSLPVEQVENAKRDARAYLQTRLQGLTS